MRIILLVVNIGLFLVISLASANALQYTTTSLGADWRAYKINNNSQVIGSDQDYPTSALLWDAEHGLRTIGSFTATSINDHGQIVGNIWHDGAWHAYEWNEQAGLQHLGQWFCTDINNNGLVVGSRRDEYGRNRLILWNGSTLRDLPSWNYYVNDWPATGINDSGEVVGYTYYGSTVLWDETNGPRVIVPFTASDINNCGQIVGSIKVGQWNRPYIWDEVNGLQPILPDGFEDNRHWFASGINDYGQIVGLVYTDAGWCQESVLWTPVPEPTSIAILASGIGCMAYTLIRRRNS